MAAANQIKAAQPFFLGGGSNSRLCSEGDFTSFGQINVYGITPLVMASGSRFLKVPLPSPQRYTIIFLRIIILSFPVCLFFLSMTSLMLHGCVFTGSCGFSEITRGHIMGISSDLAPRQDFLSV